MSNYWSTTFEVYVYYQNSMAKRMSVDIVCRIFHNSLELFYLFSILLQYIISTVQNFHFYIITVKYIYYCLHHYHHHEYSVVYLSLHILPSLLQFTPLPSSSLMLCHSLPPPLFVFTVPPLSPITISLILIWHQLLNLHFMIWFFLDHPSIIEWNAWTYTHR